MVLTFQPRSIEACQQRRDWPLFPSYFVNIALLPRVDVIEENEHENAHIALGTLTLLAGASWAATVNGIVKEFKQDTRVITLAGGKSYTVPADVALPADLSAGTQITFTTDDSDAPKVTAVTVAM
ncbi:hypothetical protein [Mesorhizobium sp. ANAO-SY3R2]|uniref:hypothetical protein n=1 Tax=Mesorhizobium sp. ANAO-SY3R2 TaxID=3166644 RepID=UPI00366A5BDB